MPTIFKPRKPRMISLVNLPQKGVAVAVAKAGSKHKQSISNVEYRMSNVECRMRRITAYRQHAYLTVQPFVEPLSYSR
jgi:hypothetical protein